MRVVVDANVWVSAFLNPSGSPGRAIDAALDGPTEIVSTGHLWQLPEDPADNWVIQCSLTAKAERIVTGDRKLLEVSSVEGVRIVTARNFLIEFGMVVP